ncbi:MAG: amino acid permease, partial [Candidatus Dormibacteraceae bacterium]
YCLLQASFVGAIDWHAMGINPGDWLGLKTSSWSGAPFAKALQASSTGFVGAFSIVLLIDAYISPGATGFVYQGIGARTIYGLSAMSYLPDVFQRLNRSRIPWVGLLGAFIIGCLLFAPFPSWYSIVSVASSTIAIVLVMSGIGLSVLRRTAPNLPRLYRLGFSQVLAPAATASAVLLVYWSGYTTVVVVVAAALIVLPAWSALFAPAKGWMDQRVGIVMGILYLAAWIAIQAWGGWFLAPATKPLSDHPPFGLYIGAMAVAVAIFMLLCYLFSSARGRTEVWRSAWLLFFILGVLPISYFGAYGPLPKPWIPFPWDSVAAIVLGLIVYFWGTATGFATELVQEVNARGSGVVTDADEQALVTQPVPGGDDGSGSA